MNEGKIDNLNILFCIVDFYEKNIIYLRANNGPIIIHQYKGSKGNIYLTGSATRILNLGQIASFIKIDNNDNGQTSTYQLLSISN